MEFITDEVLGDAIAAMPTTEFDTHQFLELLVERHPHAYIRELYSYIDGPDPFKAVHTQVARGLDAPTFGHVVEKMPARNSSPNIHGKSSPVHVWRCIT